MAAPQLSDKEKGLIVKIVIFLGVMYGAVWGSQTWVSQFTAAERNLNSELKEEEADFRTRLSQIQDEERLQNQYVESYRNYQDQGLILGRDYVEDEDFAAEQDEIRRLALLEKLQEIQQNRSLFRVISRLTQPENLPPSFSEYTMESDVAVRTYLMNVQMPMLHSLDMLMLLNDFYDEDTNRFVPVKCTMSRLGEYTGDPEDLLTADEKLNGECDLVWLTIYDPLQGRVTAGGEVEAEAATEGT